MRGFSVKQSRRPGPLPRGVEPHQVWAVVVALSSDGARAAAVTPEGTVYVWDVATGKPLFDRADADAGGPPPGSLRFGRDGSLLAPVGDRYGMQHIDIAAKAPRALTAGAKAYGLVAATRRGRSTHEPAGWRRRRRHSCGPATRREAGAPAPRASRWPGLRSSAGGSRPRRRPSMHRER